MLNETHDPELRSWVESANRSDSDFPVQNLPFGIFRRAASAEPFRGGVAIGDQILDLFAVLATGAMQGPQFGPSATQALVLAAGTTLNEFMAAGPEAWSSLRRALSRALTRGSPVQVALAACLIPQSEAELALPAHIGDYSDFYTSIYHATAVGRLMRPDNPLLPNYKWIPIGYHGRASSVGVSGQPIVRPHGQLLLGGSVAPELRPTQRLDYELELGMYIGIGNGLGKAIDIERAESHIFGLCLLNDWSARDVQAWEYQPLGPFLAKSFATTVSPWVVSLEALAPFRLPMTRDESDPQPLPYLRSEETARRGAFDIELEVYVQTDSMRAAAHSPLRLSRSSFRHCYWTLAQLVAHHSVNGCNLRPADLLGTGTQSGPTPAEAGSLLEMTQGGKQAIELGNGEQRRFLEDGDTIIMKAHCARAGAVRIGFGECVGSVLPANALEESQA